MKVAFDGSVLLGRFATGVERSFLHTLAALRAAQPQHELVVLFPGTATAALPSGVVGRALGGGQLAWRERRLAAVLRGERFDLLHAPVAALPLWRSCPAVATVHELPWREPDATRADWRLADRLRVRLLPRLADVVLTPSQHTATRLAQELPGLGARIRVAPHAVDPRFFAVRGGAGDYLLVVAAARPRKNLPFLLRAVARARELAPAVPPLRVVGPPAHYVADADLPAVVAGARALLLPSRSEGFGLPLLEAMAAGVPVLASDRGALPEIAGGAALHASATDAAAFAQAIVRIATDTALRQQLVAAGAARAREFTAARAVAGWCAAWAAAVGS